MVAYERWLLRELPPYCYFACTKLLNCMYRLLPEFKPIVKVPHKPSYYMYMSLSLSNAQIMHSNIQITSTNIQQYCTVQNPFFNRFGEKLATAWHDNFWINYCSFSWRNLIDSFFQPIKILHLTRHAPCVTPHVSPAFFLFRYVHKIHYRNSWIINNLLDI